MRRSNLFLTVRKAMPFFEKSVAGEHNISPLEDEDISFVSSIKTPLHGVHPLPINTVPDAPLRPHISPYMPSPQRPHPYFTAPIEELPHFNATTPIVHSFNTIKETIIVPVFNLQGEVTHTRELDPFIFGCYPQSGPLFEAVAYWQVRAQNFENFWDHENREIWSRAKRPWAHTGTGKYRTRTLKTGIHIKGGRSKPMKPWTTKMPAMKSEHWCQANRMMLTLKMLQGRLQVVDRLTLEEPTVESFLGTCHTMKWDVRHTGAGALFMDGGSRLAPSIEFDRNFFYGSFFNGRVKAVRPTILKQTDYDWNYTGAQRTYLGPRGPKNPVPLNRFNCFDAFEHDRLVITEGALAQLENECFDEKVRILPPHIQAQMAAMGMLDHHLAAPTTPFGRDEVSSPAAVPLRPIEFEAAGRIEESEVARYEPYYDNPYNPWRDEAEASYVVDGVDGKIRREVNGKKASWAMLE